jgi:hypothetical protein
MKAITRNDSDLLASRLILLIILGAMAFVMAVTLFTGF